MLPLDLLRISLAWGVLFRIEVTRVGSPIIGFDHGAGHSLLLLYDAKTSHGENIINFNGLGYDPSAGLYRSILDHNKIYH